MAYAIPTLQTQGLSPRNSNAPPTPHLNSGRRLSKSVLTASSKDLEASKAWGLVSVRGPDGTEHACRVVQKAESEDFNMIKVTWQWFDEAHKKSYVVDLRHGRKSGIRKIYVNKEIIIRTKDIKKLLYDNGSRDGFDLGDNQDAAIEINPNGLQGYSYTLSINGTPIEQQVSPQQSSGLDIGVRAIQLRKTAEGLGMTLRNNPLGGPCAVVWSVEPGKEADQNNIMIGDVVLSIEDNLVDNIDNLVAYVAESKDVVNMELAGLKPSRLVQMKKKLPGINAGPGENKPLPIGLGLQSTSCGVGILITEIDKNSAADECGQLRIGDCILSINGRVPKSPKEAVEFILDKESDVCSFVLADSSTTIG